MKREEPKDKLGGTTQTKYKGNLIRDHSKLVETLAGSLESVKVPSILNRKKSPKSAFFSSQGHLISILLSKKEEVALVAFFSVQYKDLFPVSVFEASYRCSNATQCAYCQTITSLLT